MLQAIAAIVSTNPYLAPSSACANHMIADIVCVFSACVGTGIASGF